MFSCIWMDGDDMKIRELLEDEDIRGYLRIGISGLVIFLLAILVLYFLFRTGTDIVFSSYEIAYGSTENTISLIESVGGSTVTDQNRSGNMIIINDMEITANEIDTRQLGEHRVVYSFSDPDIDDVEIVVTVVDKVPPTITILDDSVDYDKEEVDESLLLENVKVADNETPDPMMTVTLDPEEYDYGDEVTVRISAEDRSGNEMSSTFQMHINEAPEPEPEENRDMPADPSRQEPSSSSPSPSTGGASQVQRPSSSAKDKFFSAEEYDMITASQLCASELTSSGRAGNCVGIFDENNIYQGMQLHFD